MVEAKRSRSRRVIALIALLLLGATAIPGSLAARKLIEEQGKRARPNVRVERYLKRHQVTFNFCATPFSEIAEFFSDMSGQSFVTTWGDWNDEKKVDHRVHRVSYVESFDEISDLSGVDWRIVHGAVLWYPHGSEPRGHVLRCDPEFLASLESKRVTLGIRPSTAIDELARTFSEASGVAFVGTGDSTTGCAFFKDMPLDDAVALCALAFDLDVAVEGSSIAFTSR